MDSETDPHSLTRNCFHSTIATYLHTSPPKFSPLVTWICFSLSLITHSPIIKRLSTSVSVLHFYKLSFPHPWFILLSGQQTLHPQGGDMCVMSHSVIPYQGDRSHPVSITMMEVATTNGRMGKGYDKVIPIGRERGGKGYYKSPSIHKVCEWVSVSQTHTYS